MMFVQYPLKLMVVIQKQFYLLINNDKFILRPGNLFIKNRWDSILNQDKLAHKHADRIKNIIGIKEIK